MKRRSSVLTSRIFRVICLAVLITVTFSIVLIVGVLYEHYTNVHYDTLHDQAQILAHGVDKYGVGFLDDIDISDQNITLLAHDGTIIFDTSDDEIDKSEREAFLEAQDRGFGERSRILPSLVEKYFYTACRLESGSVLILSEKQATFFSPITGFVQRVLIIAAVAVAAAFLLAHGFSRTIMLPFKRIDLDSPEKVSTYAEIMPLLGRIDAQKSELALKDKLLRSKQIEFETATENLHEGLVLLDLNSAIISINRSASEILGIGRESAAGSPLTDRDELTELVEAAKNGESTERVLDINGNFYRVNAGPVLSEDSPVGAMLFLFDITDRMRSESMRREFTANVSHELKTPLQSISGYAELIMNNMVKREDIPKFGGRIYSEAGRITLLVEDILKLSKLDEGAVDMTPAMIDLLDAVRSVLQNAEKGSVTVKLEGNSTRICAYPSLVSAILHNLIENAVKYNREGGSVTVTVRSRSDGAEVIVADTGIGIPPEHLDRIFERFYRVDKSRSKQVGGTGLGLAIVKHAAQLHNAKVSVESEVGKGTTVTVVFPLSVDPAMYPEKRSEQP